jgi:hypothetical protein
MVKTVAVNTISTSYSEIGLSTVAACFTLLPDRMNGLSSMEPPLTSLFGTGQLEKFEANSPTGHIEGMTVRTYDAKSRQWSIYWANQSDGKFSLPATVGQFKDGRGEFFDQEDYKGKSIFVRYTWASSPDSPQWEQAFSSDGGKTWAARIRRQKPGNVEMAQWRKLELSLPKKIFGCAIRGTKRPQDTLVRPHRIKKLQRRHTDGCSKLHSLFALGNSQNGSILIRFSVVLSLRCSKRPKGGAYEQTLP